VGVRRRAADSECGLLELRVRRQGDLGLPGVWSRRAPSTSSGSPAGVLHECLSSACVPLAEGPPRRPTRVAARTTGDDTRFDARTPVRSRLRRTLP
jgi:hypothetical protein